MTPGADPSGVTPFITPDPDDTASEPSADIEFEARSATPILRARGQLDLTQRHCSTEPESASGVVMILIKRQDISSVADVRMKVCEYLATHFPLRIDAGVWYAGESLWCDVGVGCGGGVRGRVIRSRWARGFLRDFEKQNCRRGLRVSAAFRRLLAWEIVDFIRASALLLPHLEQRKPS